MESRFNGDVDLSIYLLPNILLKYPIISANMDTVTEHSMVTAMHRLGGLGIIHRFMKPECHLQLLQECEGPKVICIGVGHSSRARLEHIVNEGAWKNPDPRAVLIDIAHGHCTTMIDQIKWVRAHYPEKYIIAGNISTYEAALDLIDAGADSLKVGVGPGSLCTTRVRTGAGMPQLTAIDEVARAAQEVNKPISIIADGGIRNSGDVMKALAVGAHAVMIGNLFSGTDESPGDIFMRGSPPIKYKTYRGMASRKAQESWKGYATSVEGEMIDTPYKGPVKGVFDELIAGMLSGMSYQNAHNLGELQKNHCFIRQTINGYRESTPHGL
jgi:IMP dehydrogenase